MFAAPDTPKPKGFKMGDFIEQVQCDELTDDRIVNESEDGEMQIEIMQLPPWTDLIWD